MSPKTFGVAAPIPRLAPVTNATLFDNSFVAAGMIGG